jgi:broad specificity phosphatase PhoE
VTTILLARHGESTWNAKRRWQGHADPPLSQVGRKQALALARSLENVELDAIYASDLNRAAATAAVVADLFGRDVITDPALREIDVGEWGGLTTEEIKARYPAGWARHRAGGDGWEHGETHAAMSRRIVAAASRIASRHPRGRILCVLHGGVMRALLAHASAMPLGEYRRTQPGPANGTVSRIAVEEGAFRRID